MPVQLADADELASWLSAKAEGRVELATPQRGAKAQMLEMAERNAAQMLAEQSHKREMRRDRVPQLVYALQPDLLLIDGGKGQFASAVGALRELGIAKRFEEVFLPGEAQPRILPKTSVSLRLLQTLRDEAHGFALKNHRDQRAKSTLTSTLDDIPGIGPKKRNALLKAFGSVKRIAATPLEEITAIPGFSQKQAGELLAYLNGLRDDQGKTAASDAAQQDTDT